MTRKTHHHPSMAAWGALALAATILSVACNRNDSPANSPGTTSATATSSPGCGSLPNADDLKRLLRAAPDSGEAGGLFHGRSEWGAVVDRDGNVCAIVAGTDSVGGRWPGSRNIARAKAFTANGFSTDTLAFSTARLYTLTQPGHSLWGVAQPEAWNPACHDPSNNEKLCGGAIAFGGGLALYKSGRIVGGLGVSGDTPCTDHEIAKRIRHMAGFDPKAGMGIDDIVYTKTDGPSIYAHPLCPNTWRNGQKIGDEPPATTY